MSLIFDDAAFLEALRQRPAHVPHIHWDGSIPFEELWQHYQRKGEKLFLPEKHHDGTPVTRNREINSVEELLAFRDGMFTQYGLVDVFKVPTMAMQTTEDLQKMAVAHCRYLQSQNIRSAETRFAPWYRAREGQRGSTLSMGQAIGHALEGFAQGKEETGVDAKLVVCINREVSSDAAVEIIKAALPFAEHGVVGIDLVCYEPPFPPESFEKAYALTFDTPLRRAVHADEMCAEEQGVKNILTALERLRADSIGHAVHLHSHPELIDLMLAYNVRLESNPISNLTCDFIRAVEDLHLDELVKAGVNVTINPDDPAMWPNGDLAHNLYVVGKLYGDRFVDTVLKNARETAWK